jgi:heme-degrading monooxygenase HmoA
MLIEHSEITAKQGMEQDFFASMTDKGVPLLANVPGVRWVQFGRGVEHPQKFMLLVVWETMDAHTAFTKTPARTELGALIRPFSTGGAMEHFEMAQPVSTDLKKSSL